MLLNKVHKTRHGLRNRELLNIGRSTCCRFNLHDVLEEKYGHFIEPIYIKDARLCRKENIRVDWQREGFIFPKQCKYMEYCKHSTMLTPLPDVHFNSLRYETGFHRYC